MAKLNDVFKKEVKTENHPKRITKWIHYTKLESNQFQYCDAKNMDEIIALADLIEADGEVLQDVLVRKKDTDAYEIIAGHKRTQACKYLVETRNKKEYAFVPCVVKNLSDVRAQFQLYSSNGRHEKTPYEIMHELETMKHLLETYPEEFPQLQSGRMVERLAKQMNLKKSTVGEYQQISNNLGDTAMEAFKKGEIGKSAAVSLSTMSEEHQEQVLSEGITKDTEIKRYKEQKIEPSKKDIEIAYEIMKLKKYKVNDWHEVKKEFPYQAINTIGRSHSGKIDCDWKGIRFNNKDRITWHRFAQLLNLYIPQTADVRTAEKTESEAEESLPGQYEIVNKNMDIKPATDVVDSSESSLDQEIKNSFRRCVSRGETVEKLFSMWRADFLNKLKEDKVLSRQEYEKVEKFLLQCNV